MKQAVLMVCLSTLMICASTGVLAETRRAKAPTAPVIAPQAVPSDLQPTQIAPADDAQPDTSQLTRQALVRKYFAAIQFDKLMDSVTNSILQQQMAALGDNPRLTPEIQAALVSSATATMRDIRPDMMGRYVEIYADILTEPELAALVRFYESDVGHSITLKSQVLAAQAGPVVQEFMPRIQAGMQQRLCAQITCPSVGK